MFVSQIVGNDFGEEERSSMFKVKAVDPLGEVACTVASVSDQEEFNKIEVCLQEAKFTVLL